MWQRYKRFKLKLKITQRLSEIYCIPVLIQGSFWKLIMHKLLFSCIFTQTRTFILCYSKPLVSLLCHYFSSVWVSLPVTVINTMCSRLHQSLVSVQLRVKSPSLYLETSKKSAEGHNYTSSRCVLWNQQRDWSPARPHVVSSGIFFFKG